MKEKKNIFKKVKDWWNSIDKEGRAMIKGSFIGGCIGGFSASMIAGKVNAKQQQIMAQVAEDETVQAYRRGIKDGEMRGYYNLLVNTDQAFRKMGMEPKHF